MRTEMTLCFFAAFLTVSLCGCFFETNEELDFENKIGESFLTYNDPRISMATDSDGRVHLLADAAMVYEYTGDDRLQQGSSMTRNIVTYHYTCLDSQVTVHNFRNLKNGYTRNTLFDGTGRYGRVLAAIWDNEDINLFSWRNESWNRERRFEGNNNRYGVEFYLYGDSMLQFELGYPDPGFQVENQNPVYFNEFLGNDTWFMELHTLYMNNTNYILGLEIEKYNNQETIPQQTLVIYTYSADVLDRMEFMSFGEEWMDFSARIAYVNDQCRLYMTFNDSLFIYNIEKNPPEILDTYSDGGLRRVDNVKIDPSGIVHSVAWNLRSLPLSDSIFADMGEKPLTLDEFENSSSQSPEHLYYYSWKNGIYTLDTIPLPEAMQNKYELISPSCAVDQNGSVYIALIITPTSATFDLSGYVFGSRLYLASKEQDEWRFQFIDEK